MKSETKIAEENIKLDDGIVCAKHKASCQRFLEFLEKQEKYLTNLVKEGIQGNHFLRNINAITYRVMDLKNAIKKYDEAGI